MKNTKNKFPFDEGNSVIGDTIEVNYKDTLKHVVILEEVEDQWIGKCLEDGKFYSVEFRYLQGYVIFGQGFPSREAAIREIYSVEECVEVVKRMELESLGNQ